MTKLTLTKVRWQNFLSYGNTWTEIDLNAHKITLIVGINGAGKSTLLDAISFGLFNKPFRKINKPTLVNTITGKNCVVEVEFLLNGNEFKVVRGIKPDIFEIYKNDELLNQDAENRDYQGAFEKYVLRTNHKSFCQIFVLGSAIFTPFMALEKGKRREIIEDLLDMRIFTAMNTLLKTDIQTTEYEIYQKQNEKKIVDEKLKLTYEHIKEIQESTAAAVAEKLERIKNAQDSITNNTKYVKAYKEEIKTLEEQKEGEELIKKSSQEMAKINNQLEMKIGQIEKEIKFLTDNENCPTCTQVIEPSFKEDTLLNKHNHLSELEKGLSKLEEKHSKVKTQVEKFISIQRNIDKIRNTKDKIENDNENLERYITELNDDIKKAKANIATDITKPTDLEASQKELETTLIKLNEERTLQGYAANMLKDTGIKARIIKTYIPIINQLIAKYSSILDFFVDFQLNEEFVETIKSRFRDNFSYENFSEGEKMRLNLAILFTWRAIAKLRNSIDCNILVFDEVLDSSLDSEGVDNMIKLLQQAAPDTRVFIISHRDAIMDKFDNVITFEKKSNFSRITDT